MIASAYFSEISCRSAISFSGMYAPLSCSARSIITRSAYLPFVDIFKFRTSMTLFYHTEGRITTVARPASRRGYAPGDFAPSPSCITPPVMSPNSRTPLPPAPYLWKILANFPATPLTRPLGGAILPYKPIGKVCFGMRDRFENCPCEHEEGAQRLGACFPKRSAGQRPVPATRSGAGNASDSAECVDVAGRPHIFDA